jgi:hypothetical protein
MDVVQSVCSEKESPFEKESLSRRATVRLVHEMNSRLLVQLNGAVQVAIYCSVALDDSTDPSSTRVLHVLFVSSSLVYSRQQ